MVVVSSEIVMADAGVVHVGALEPFEVRTCPIVPADKNAVVPDPD